jgi:hypothetical protein
VAVKLADAVVEIATDQKKLDSGLDGAQKKTSGWGSMLSGVMAGVGIAVANAAVQVAQAAIGQIGAIINSASDLSETVAKTGELFGASTDEIVAWSTTASTAFGQSQQQALDAAATFATFGRAAGLGGADLVGFSTQLTELASDLASFNNTSPEQAINAIGAALRGETEPMRAYGVLLDDASMRAQALKMGLIETTKEALTPQQKVLAAQALILAQTTTAQGDFARTSDGLANSSRSLTAQWEDMKATLGSALLPMVEAVMGALNKFVTAVLPPLRDFIVSKIVPAVQSFGAVLGAFVSKYGTAVAQWVQGVLAWFGKLIGGTGDVQSKGGDSLGKFIKSVVNLVTTVVGAVASILAELAKLVGWFLFNDAGELRGWAKVVLGIFQVIIDAVSNVIDWIARLVRALGAVLRGDLSGALNELVKWNGSTAGMVPLLDSGGNRIGWQSEEQARLKGELNQSRATTNNVTVNITSSGNASQLGRELSLGVQDALRAVGAH